MRVLHHTTNETGLSLDLWMVSSRYQMIQASIRPQHWTYQTCEGCSGSSGRQMKFERVYHWICEWSVVDTRWLKPHERTSQPMTLSKSQEWISPLHHLNINHLVCHHASGIVGANWQASTMALNCHFLSPPPRNPRKWIHTQQPSDWNGWPTRVREKL